MNINNKRKPKRSLRWVLALWFFLFAIIPVIFLTYYSLGRFQKAMDHELAYRLRSNAFEINIIISEYQASLEKDLKILTKHPKVISELGKRNKAFLSDFLKDWQLHSASSLIKLYDREGTLVAETHKSIDIEPNSTRAGAIKIEALHDNIKSHASNQRLYLFVDYTGARRVRLNLLGSLGSDSAPIGYALETLTLNDDFLRGISRRMQIQTLLLEPNGRIIAGSHPDFNLYPTDFFVELLKDPKLLTFNLPLRGELYGFTFNSIKWGNNEFKMALSASKKNANEAMKNLKAAYYTLLGMMFGLLALSVLVASQVVLHPLSELIEAIQDFHLGENTIELPVKSDNEIGQLTTSFNDLSRRILQTQRQLKNKIKELEETNADLQLTQGQLVHSAKMAGLGQLVAGVAHELNNPIGFIYSNMAHLREYSDSLLELIECAERSPQELNALKRNMDLEFIKKDLPRLIKSCEDGARRTKDIVLGLRNFSRLEGDAVTPTNLHLALDTTLELLNSEFKNKIEVKKSYGVVPPVLCNASQINQVFMNILSNAAQAIKGKGIVWISTQVKDISNSGSTTLPSVIISIQDNGPGIAEDQIQKIFDPFYTTKAVGQGTGLGLAISYGIIQSHGGQIEVQSKLGEGSEFIITLPIQREGRPILTQAEDHRDPI